MFTSIHLAGSISSELFLCSSYFDTDWRELLCKNLFNYI